MLSLIGKYRIILGSYLIATAIIIAGIVFYISGPTMNFSNHLGNNTGNDSGIVVEVQKGQNLKSISAQLESQKIIRSPLIFRTLISLLGGEKKIKIGFYKFDEAQSVFTVASRFVKNDYGFNMIKLTIPEGSNYRDIAKIVGSKSAMLPSINIERLSILAKSKEGYLFPETYFVPPFVDENYLVNLMSDEFSQKIAKIDDQVRVSGKSLQEIITMASVLEEEAQTAEDRALISDIFWRRISKGMPLQSCSTLGYVTGKGSLQLSPEDLKSKDPYNTYVFKGLPPGPISNPGLEAIKSALNPKANNYVYFLSDKDNKMHYSVDYNEHLQQKRKYLD